MYQRKFDLVLLKTVKMIQMIKLFICYLNLNESFIQGILDGN